MDRAGRFEEKLREQLGFVQRSCAHFDEGHEEEAVRLATTLRVLFHDAQRRDGRASSTSLLTHLSMDDTTMLTTPRTNFADWRDFLSVRIDLSSKYPTTLIPRLEDQFQPIPFLEWWSGQAVMEVDGQAITRKKLILAAANQDGGAHIDATLQRFYQELAAGQYSLGITGNLTCNGVPPFEQGATLYPPNGHLALLRQFAHEALATANHLSWAKPSAS